MDWQPYRACCHRLAADSDVGFCPECGHALMRCLAFAECRSLVTPTQACPSCVAPVLMIDAGAVVRSKAGERMSVPLILLNSSPAGRPLWVKNIVKWDGKANEPLSLTWDQLDAGTERRFSLDTPPMAEGGTYTLRVILVVASRYKGIEEEYAFAGGMSINVSGPDAQQVIQNINLSGATIGTGATLSPQASSKGQEINLSGSHFETGAGTVYAPGSKPPSSTAPGGLENRAQVSLERAEKYELEQGIRGYRKEGLRVRRHVEFTFSGFRHDDTPAAGAALVPRGRLLVGRNARKADPTANPSPNDVCLRAYDARTKAIDEPATLAISRHHFELLVVNDRFCVQARATGGMQVNGDDVGTGQVFPIVPGDRIIPIPGRGDKLTLRVAFVSAFGAIERIDVSRTPAIASTP